MFRSATFKLTMWYLAMVMAISLVFSAAVYHFATAELARGLNRQSARIYREFPVFENDPFFEQHNDLHTGSQHILFELAYFNILVFIGAGFASYALAKRTLSPIEQAHEQQKRFTADVSHELRTPLTALKMGTEVALIDKGAGEPQLRQALESNLEEANKINTLINNLLRLTRLDAWEIRESFTPVEVNDIITAATGQLLAQAQAKHIKLESVPASLKVAGDRDSLEQLLVILLDNAIKYSPPKSSVSISASQAAGHVRLTVSDEGHGIEPAALEHAFDRFYRADSSRTKTDTEGFGLGLSIAKMIADMHNGTITLTSKVGKGTTATVLLPAAHLPQ